MGAWSASITGNDTAQDLKSEYAAAFYYYDVPKAVRLIDEFVRAEGFDENDPEEWCDYFYSLTDFMWKKGILTDDIKQRALEMIDSDYGLELWAESGEKILKARKQTLEKFKKQLLSPLPAKKRIKPNTYTEDYFSVGDIIVIQLQTADKVYVKYDERPMSDAEFRSYDGKYILMQKIKTNVSWESAIVPEVKNNWLIFRLFDGVYDEIPTEIDRLELKDAKIHGPQRLTPLFSCESSLFYFRKRKYQLLGNSKKDIEKYKELMDEQIFGGVDKPWHNPDSFLLAAMGKEIRCYPFNESIEVLQKICRNANLYGRYIYRLSKEENEARFRAEEEIIFKGIEDVISSNGAIYSLEFGRTVGIISVCAHQIKHFYVIGWYQNIGLGTQLLKYVLEVYNHDLYMNVSEENERLIRVCEKAGMFKSSENELEGYYQMRCK